MCMREGDTFGIVRKSYWRKRKALRDSSFDGAISAILPPGFSETSESVFEYHRGDLEEGRWQLKRAGFEEIANPWEEDDPSTYLVYVCTDCLRERRVPPDLLGSPPCKPCRKPMVKKM